MKRPAAAAPPAKIASPPARPGQTLKVFAAAVFLALVLPLLLLAGLMGWHQYQILHNWPVADAVVTKSEVTTSAAAGSAPAGRRYGVRFKFRYTAAGRVYETSADVAYDSPHRAQVERWVQQMPVGSHQRIRYDPGDPAHISLAVDYTPRAFAAPRALAKWAVIIAAASTGLFGLGWRAGKQRPGAGSQQSAKPA